MVVSINDNQIFIVEENILRDSLSAMYQMFQFTGRARLIRSHSSTMISFKISGNMN